MNRRDFIKTGLCGAATFATHPAAALAKTKHELTPEEILAGAPARIAKYRKGDGVVTVRDHRGKRILGAAVKIEQLRHDFLFGSNLFMYGRNGNPTLEQQYCDRFSALLNYCTLGFYWGDYERERGKPRYEYTDEVVDYCLKHDIACKGHPLVWDYKDLVPGWLPNDLKEIEKLSKARVSEIVGRYKGRINIWDVVNEATHIYEIKEKSRLDEVAIAMGQTPFVAEHLKAARAANPSAALLVNDYKDNEPYHKLLDTLREDKHLLFDAIGLQSHQHRGVWPLTKVWRICELFSDFKVPLHFTESTIVSGKRADKTNWGPTTPEDEAKQADYTEYFYTTLFSHPAVHAITWWDFSDLGAWQGAPSGWLRNDMSPKPVYNRLLSLIKLNWWTKTNGHTNALGNFHTRAFFGKHRITATVPSGAKASKEVHWQRGARNHFEITVGRNV